MESVYKTSISWCLLKWKGSLAISFKGLSDLPVEKRNHRRHPGKDRLVALWERIGTELCLNECPLEDLSWFLAVWVPLSWTLGICETTFDLLHAEATDSVLQIQMLPGLYPSTDLMSMSANGMKLRNLLYR